MNTQNGSKRLKFTVYTVYEFSKSSSLIVVGQWLSWALTWRMHFSSTVEPRAWCNVTDCHEIVQLYGDCMRLQGQLQGQGSGEPTKHNDEKWCCSWNSLQNGQHRLPRAFKALQRIQDPDTFHACFHNVFTMNKSSCRHIYVHLCASMCYVHLCPHVPLPQPPHEACHSKNHSQDLVALNSLPICPGHAMLHSKVRRTLISDD